jgi:nucleotide-binding universal stress UspA family protein
MSTSTAAAGAVVVGVDGSPAAERAVLWACDEASRLHRSLHVLHAAARTAPRAPLYSAVSTAHRRCPGLRVTSELSCDPPATALVQASRSAHTLVLGARGRGGLAALVLGSVSTEVARQASCPVVVVKDADDADRPRDSVVVGVDGGAPSQPALGYAFEQASSRGTALDVVHAWSHEHAPLTGVLAEALSADYQVEPDKELLVAECLAGWREEYPDVDVRVSLVHGEAVSALLEHGDGAELVVVGSRGRSAVAGLLLGSVSHNVLQRAGGPVAVVRAERSHAGRTG